MNFTSLYKRSLLITLLMSLTACNQASSKKTTQVESSTKLLGNKHMIHQSAYGIMPNGEQVTQYTLTNKLGTEVSVISYGGIITSLKTIDKNGDYADIVLGYDKLEDYLIDGNYFGALIGRFGNRIGKSKFSLDGVEYTLSQNDGDNHLHGGAQGFDKQNWFVTPFTENNQPGLKLQLLSQDGDQGYPGNAVINVTYLLNNNNELMIDYQAISDKNTLMNLTQHSYFNLAGKGNILDHQLTINANEITPVDGTLIPTGEYQAVENTPFDFRKPTNIGAKINDQDAQLGFGLGYDHNYVLNKEQAGQLELAATVYEPNSGRVMEILTEEPGIQFYSGNFLDGSALGKGRSFKYRNGFCLEPQHYPDSPNKPHFPSTTLLAGETYKTQMIYRFSVIQ